MDPTKNTANRAVNNLKGKLKNSFLNSYPHHTVPGYNLNRNLNVDNFDDDHFIDLFREFPYNPNFPRPLLPPAKLPQCVLRNNDPALEFLRIKSDIKDNINRITEYHEKYRRDLTVCHKKHTKWTNINKTTAEKSLPRYIAELAEIMESDPDPQFEGEYNWYFTGGSLDHLILSGRNILLFPFAKELVAAPIFEKQNSLWKPNLEQAGKCCFDSTLYEIRHTVTSDHTCRILGRQKYSCNLYTMSESDEKLELDEIHQQPTNSPYVSADLSPIEFNKYCTANSERLVEYWDLNRTRCLTSTSMLKPNTHSDNWLSVKINHMDPKLIVVVDRCCLYYIDTRSPLDGPSLTLCPKDELEICENLSMNVASEHNSFYQYLGTYHSLLLCDARFENSGVVQKWTHQFKSPPIFSNVVDRNSEEIITLSSQLSGENSIILNNWTNESTSHSYSLPFMPSSISDTLKACQDEGKCLDPSMRGRLELCNVGATLNSNDKNEVNFFTQNSIGDIFYQCITYNKILGNNFEINKKSILAMEAWEKAYFKQQRTLKPLCVSEKANMKHIVDKMKNRKNQHGEHKGSEKPDIEPKWSQSIEKLNSYVDILAPELLSVWDVRQDSVPFTVTSHQKVLSWLEKKTPTQTLSQSQNITQSQDSTIFNESNEISTQELISVSQNIEQKYTPDIIEIEQFDDAPASVRTHKKIVKKKKYVAGF